MFGEKRILSLSPPMARRRPSVLINNFPLIFLVL